MGTFRSLRGIKVWLVCNDYRVGGEGLDASPPNIPLEILVIQIECNSIGDVPAEEQTNLLKYLERKETEYMRIWRHKMSVDDFELLTIIGRGAFGEVVSCHSLLC